MIDDEDREFDVKSRFVFEGNDIKIIGYDQPNDRRRFILINNLHRFEITKLLRGGENGA